MRVRFFSSGQISIIVQQTLWAKETQIAQMYPDHDLQNTVCYSFKPNLGETQNNSTAALRHFIGQKMN